MKRRAWLASWTLAMATWARSSPADAAESRKKVVTSGPPTIYEYLARAALLLDENRRSLDWVFGHPGDRGLAELASHMAETRALVASEIVAPAVARQAHMHLLLVLEITAAAFDASAGGDDKKAAQRISAARSEEQTLATALEAAKLKLPTLR